MSEPAQNSALAGAGQDQDPRGGVGGKAINVCSSCRVRSSVTTLSGGSFTG